MEPRLSIEVVREKVETLVVNLSPRMKREMEKEMDRLDILMRLNNHIYNVARGALGASIADDILWWSTFDDNLQSVVTFKLFGYALEPRAFKWARQNLYISLILTAIYFVKPEKIPVNEEIREALKYLKYPDIKTRQDDYGRVVQRLFTEETERFVNKLGQTMASWIRRLKKQMIMKSRNPGGGDRIYEMLDKLLDKKALPFFLARKIAVDALESYAGIAERGSRIAVLGNLGVGKSTTTYHSIYAALRILRTPDALAMEAARALVTNKPIVHLMLLYAATNPDLIGPDFRLPALVLDDAATEVSKYWQYERKEERDLTIKLSRLVKVTREGLGNVFFLADKKDNLPKGIRDSLDYEVIGAPFSLDSGLVSSTLWVVNYIHPKIVPKSGYPTRAQSELMELRRIYVVFGTASPPVYMPSGVYEELKKEKLSVRERLVAETLESQAKKEEIIEDYAEI